MVRMRWLALGALVVSGPVMGEANGQAPGAEGTPTTAQRSGQDLNRMVCEVEETTGTRLGARRVCKTVLEWQQMRTEHRQTVEKFQQQNTSVGAPSG